MKFLNIIFLLFILLGLTACQDKVTSDKKAETVVIQPPVSPTPNDNISPLPFKGVDSITDIKQKGFTVNWTTIVGAGSYQIFFLTHEGLKLQKTLNHPKSSYTFVNLNADTEYKVVVRLMDEQGRIDINEKVLTVKTNSWPDYHNEFSLKFNGSNGVLLQKANTLIPTKNFTLSLWIKASAPDAYGNLISLHKDFSALISFGLFVENDMIGVKYITNSNESKELKTQFLYSDNKWHHIAVTYNQKWIALYLDGKREKTVQAVISTFGERPATLGFSEYTNGFAGLLDEASIWRSAIGRLSIQEIYNQGQSKDLRQHSAANILGHWFRLGDEAGDNAASITDVITGEQVIPTGIQMSDFEQDAP